MLEAIGTVQCSENKEKLNGKRKRGGEGKLQPRECGNIGVVETRMFRLWGNGAARSPSRDTFEFKVMICNPEF